jgi:hypothetical protein
LLITEQKKLQQERSMGKIFWGLALSLFGIIILLLTLVCMAVFAGDSMYT